MNRRSFIETGLTAGVAAASTGVSQAQGKKTGRLTLPQPRKIAQEVFGAGGYDAIWYLVNVGFVVRLGEVILFLDPILQSGNPLYAELRRQRRQADRLPPEVRFYDPGILYLETEHYPLTGPDVKRADYVLVTHDHTDHCEPQSVKSLSRHNPRILAPPACHPMLIEAGVPKAQLQPVAHGERIQGEGFTVQIQYAQHGNSEGACGFLLETRHGNIYHPGDGRFDHPHKAENCSLKVDYLLLPINDTNLGVGFAALLTQILQPKVVIPCHYGFTSPPVRSQGGHPAEFVTALAARNYRLPATDVLILQPGGKVVLV